jgi:hypothetical protein
MLVSDERVADASILFASALGAWLDVKPGEGVARQGE